MSWTEHELATRKQLQVDPARARLLDEVKSGYLPVISKEADEGRKSFEPLQRTPVRSPGLFEAEFAKKGLDILSSSDGVRAR